MKAAARPTARAAGWRRRVGEQREGERRRRRRRQRMGEQREGQRRRRWRRRRAGKPLERNWLLAGGVCRSSLARHSRQ